MHCSLLFHELSCAQKYDMIISNFLSSKKIVQFINQLSKQCTHQIPICHLENLHCMLYYYRGKKNFVFQTYTFKMWKEKAYEGYTQPALQMQSDINICMHLQWDNMSPYGTDGSQPQEIKQAFVAYRYSHMELTNRNKWHSIYLLFLTLVLFSDPKHSPFT